jgi:hypothetical protein
MRQEFEARYNFTARVNFHSNQWCGETFIKKEIRLMEVIEVRTFSETGGGGSRAAGVGT